MRSQLTFPAPASIDHLFEPDREAATGLRLAVLGAATIHLAIFATTWPALMQTEAAAPDPAVLRPVPLVLFVQPPPPPPRLRDTVPPRRVPIPDPDPQGPEPIRRDLPDFVPIDVPVSAVPVAPDPPPTEDRAPRRTAVTAGIDIAPPTVLYRVEPRYSESARRIRFEGAVLLSLLIDTDGRVADLMVLQSLPFGLTDNAVEAVRQWRFAPSTFRGDPVSVRYVLTVRYRLKVGPAS